MKNNNRETIIHFEVANKEYSPVKKRYIGRAEGSHPQSISARP